MIKCSKKGSVTVHLCLILSAVLLLVGTLADLSFAIASRPYADEIMDVAGRSILSEFDRDVKERYGLFFFQMEKEELEDEFAGYVEKSIRKSKGKTELLPLRVEKAVLDVTEYAASRSDILMNQIVALMKYKVFTGASDILDLLGKDARDSEKENKPANRIRKLRNRRIIDELPSRLLNGMDGGIMSLLNLPNPAQFGKVAYEEVCLNRYILDHFNHNLKNEEESFFSREVEYILCGSLSDESNGNIVYLSLLAFRTAMNAIHIKNDSGKMELIRAAALLVGEGVASPAVEASLIALWAGAEAAVDMNRLEKGKRVPLIKEKDEWKLSLSNAMEGNLPEFGIGSGKDNDNGNDGDGDSHKEKGLDYEDYLFLFLCFKSRDSKLIRIMDLIHINIKGHYNKNFSYADCAAGFYYNVELVRDRPFLGKLFLRKGEFNGCHEY